MDNSIVLAPRLAQLTADMQAAASLATAIEVAGGGRHRAQLIEDDRVYWCACQCRWVGDLVGSAVDAYAALILEHLEPVAEATGALFARQVLAGTA